MGKKLYVGNLSYGVDSSALEALFSPHGTPSRGSLAHRPAKPSASAARRPRTPGALASTGDVRSLHGPGEHRHAEG